MISTVSFPPVSVITEDNLSVDIDTVIYFTVTDPVAATYEIVNYIQGVEQLTITTTRNIVGGMTKTELADLIFVHLELIARAAIFSCAGLHALEVDFGRELAPALMGVHFSRRAALDRARRERPANALADLCGPRVGPAYIGFALRQRVEALFDHQVDLRRGGGGVTVFGRCDRLAAVALYRRHLPRAEFFEHQHLLSERLRAKQRAGQCARWYVVLSR